MANIPYFSWVQRTVVEAGPGCRTYAPLRMSSMGSTRPVLLTDQTLAKNGVTDLVKDIFDVQGAPKFVGIYDSISPEFTGAEASECARWFRENAADGIVAVGGGSVIDCSKAIKAMLGMKAKSLWELAPALSAMYTEPLAKPFGIPHIAFPTTAGTGCEASSAIVATHEDLHVKAIIYHPFMNPDRAFLDADLTVGMPPSLTTFTGFDALCHAVEGLCSLETNDMIDSYAIHAIKMIRKYLPKAVKNGKDIMARHKMLVAADMAIIPVSLAGPYYPVHNVAHGVGAAMHIPHGEANMVALPVVMDEFPAHYLKHAEKLADAFGLNSDQPAEKIVIDTAQAIRDLRVACGIDSGKFKVAIDDAMVPNLCMAIKYDVSGAMYPIPQEIVERIIHGCFEVK